MKKLLLEISGFIGLGEWVTWEAIHFGIKQKLTSKITALESPYYFVDEMVSGALKSFKHEHIFEEKEGHIMMIDRFSFEAPLGRLGRLANRLFLIKYMQKLLQKRAVILKKEAELGSFS